MLFKLTYTFLFGAGLTMIMYILISQDESWGIFFRIIIGLCGLFFLFKDYENYKEKEK